MVLGLIVIRPHERFERGVERYERLQVWRSLVVNVLVNVYSQCFNDWGVLISCINKIPF